MVTQQQLHELFEYQDGNFVCKKTNKIKKLVPITNHHRYNRVVVSGKAYAFHRLVYLYHFGKLPKIIDHIDNDRSNNRIENLREVTQQQNCLNRITHRNNKSGYKNVIWHKKTAKWSVVMSVNGERQWLGTYDDLELAGLIANEAREKYHGKFARS